MSGMQYTYPNEAADVTAEMLTLAEFIFDGWFADGNSIDWVDFLDRMDGRTLDDDSTLDLGPAASSPAVEKIKRHVRTYQQL